MSEFHADRRRISRRHSIVPVGCRIGRRRLSAVWLTELSPMGCRLVTSAGVLDAGQGIVIEPKGMGSIAGIVKWVSEIQAGIEFVDPLDETVVDDLLQDAVSGNGDSLLVDRFGRPVPELPRMSRAARSGLS